MRNYRNGGNTPKIPLTGDVRRIPIQFQIPVEETSYIDAQDILANRPNRELDQSYNIVQDKKLTTERSLQFNPIHRSDGLDLKANHFEPTGRINRDTLNVDITENKEKDALFGKYKTGNKRKGKLRHVEIPQEFEEVPVEERIDVRSIRQNDNVKGKIGSNGIDTGNLTEKQQVASAMSIRDTLHAVPNIKQDGHDNPISQNNFRNQENIRRLAAQTFKKEYGREMTYEDVEFLARSESKSEVREGRFYDNAPNIVSRIQNDGFGTVFNSLPSIMHYRDFFRKEALNTMNVNTDQEQIDFRMHPDPIHEKDFAPEKNYVERNQHEVQISSRKTSFDTRKNVGYERHDVNKNSQDLEVKERKNGKVARKNVRNGRNNIDRNHEEVADGLKSRNNVSHKKVLKGKSKLDQDATDLNPNIRSEGKLRNSHKVRESAPKDEVEVETSGRNLHGGTKYKKQVEAKARQQRDHDDGITFIAVDKMKDFTRVQTPGKSKIGIDHQEVTSKFKNSTKERKNVQLGKSMGNDDIEFLPIGKIQELQQSKSKERGNKTLNRGIQKEGHDIAMNDQKPPKTREKLTAKQGAPGAEDEEDISAPVVKQKKSKRNESKGVQLADDTKEEPVGMVHPKQIYF